MRADVLCLVEVKTEDWKWIEHWLDEKKERRLVLIETETPLFHPQIQSFSLETPLQIEPLARQIALDTIFQELEVREGESEIAHLFCKALKRAHLAANLTLSDAADWGCTLAKHAIARGKRAVRQGLKLKSAFVNVPAIIVGAGPSLERNRHLLEAIQYRALIMASSSALNEIQVEPHFAASIDKEAPYQKFKQNPFSETPFFFQSRMNPDNFSLIHGEAILFPDSHYQFLNEGDLFDSGWTVTTFLTAIATFMGCNPIVFMGMDFCYVAGRKYAGSEKGETKGLVETIARDGRAVLTQPDWLMARIWLEEWAAKHPQHRFLDATEGDLAFLPPIQEIRLSDLSLEHRKDLREQVHRAVTTLPYLEGTQWEEWTASLERCKAIADGALFGGEDDFQEERAYRSLLLPLWQIWSPIFKRALTEDVHPDKMRINRALFFQQVIQEHLSAIEPAILS